MSSSFNSLGDMRSVGEAVAIRINAHKWPRRRAIAATLQVGLLYAVIAGLALIFRDDVLPDIYLLFLSFWGALCFFMLWRRIDWGGYHFLSFGALFLLASACFRLSSFLDVLFFGNRIEAWPVYAKDPLLDVAYGELIYVLGAFLLVGTWLALRGHERSIVIIKGLKYDPFTFVVAYVIAATFIVSVRVFDVDFGNIGNLQAILFVMSMTSVLLISLGPSQKRTWARCVFLPSVLCSPLIYAALGTAMKEHLVFAALPIAIGTFVVVKGVWTRALVVSMMVIVLAFLTPFVKIQREANWIANEALSVDQVFDQTVNMYRSDNRFLANTFASVLSRKNLLESNAWSFALVEKHGHVGDFSPASSLQMFVPRFLWAEKPSFRPGSDFSDLVYGAGAGQITATAAGLFSAMYLGAGLLGVVIYSIIIGALYALSLSMVIRFGNWFSQILLLTFLGYKALRLDEAFPVYVVSEIIMVLLSAIVVGRLISRFQGSTRRARV
jgi:hypothetical protein